MTKPDPRLPAVLAAQRRFWTALQAKDAAQFEQVLAKHFVSRAPGQPDQDRAAFIETLTQFPTKVLSVNSDDLAVHFFGETAVVTGVQRARVLLPDGREVEDDIAITNVFLPGGAGYVMVMAHPVELR